MNKIEVIRGKSEYSLNDHLIIAVDGRPRDHGLNDFDLEYRHAYKGLVPTLLDRLDNRDERKLCGQGYYQQSDKQQLDRY